MTVERGEALSLAKISEYYFSTPPPFSTPVLSHKVPPQTFSLTKPHFSVLNDFSEINQRNTGKLVVHMIPLVPEHERTKDEWNLNLPVSRRLPDTRGTGDVDNVYRGPRDWSRPTFPKTDDKCPGRTNPKSQSNETIKQLLLLSLSKVNIESNVRSVTQ